MSSCTDGPARARRTPRRGQAVIEMAFVIPIGLLLLLAVGYIGRALLERQTLMAAARFAAREAALSATRSPADKALGAGILREATAAGDRSRNISEAARGRQAESAPPRWEGVTGVPTTELKPVPLGAYGRAYLAQGNKVVDGTQLKFGIGFVLYGARATERLGFLEPVRKATAGASRSNPQPAKALQSPLEISAAAYMPGELPLKQGAVGLMDINPWIRTILEEP